MAKMNRSSEAGRTTLAVDYTAATLETSPESQRILQRWRDEVVAEADRAAVEAEVASWFEVTP